VADALERARQSFLEVVDFLCGQQDPNAVYAGSVPYLMLSGKLMAGWQLGRSLLAALAALERGEDPEFMRSKMVTARFFADHVLSQAPGLRDSIVQGASSVTGLALESF